MSAAEQPDAVTIDVRHGSPTPDELAALIAVVTEAYAREAAAAVADDSRRRSAWSVTQRGLRRPLPSELGWRAAVR